MIISYNSLFIRVLSPAVTCRLRLINLQMIFRFALFLDQRNQPDFELWYIMNGISSNFFVFNRQISNGLINKIINRVIGNGQLQPVLGNFQNVIY